MFRCGICNGQTSPGVKLTMLVTIAQRLRKGWKIIREEKACPICADKFAGPKWLDQIL